MEKFFVLERRYQLLVAGFVLTVLLSAGFFFGRGLKGALGSGFGSGTEEGAGVILVEGPSAERSGGTGIVVNIKGAVRHPGIYEFGPKSRVNDAVLKAELLPEADVEALNLAQFLKDEQEILVPYKGSEGEPSGESRISINKATSAELEEIPGVGPVMAGNILAARQAKGGFRSLEELLEVSGIGQKTYEKLLPYLRL